MSLQDIEGLEQAVMEAARVLTPQGLFVFAITHPLNTAGMLGQPQRSGTAPSLSMTLGSSAASSFGKLIATDIQ